MEQFFDAGNMNISSGCRFLGIDIMERFIDAGKQRMEENGLLSGEFLVGNMLEVSQSVGENKFTHVLALGCLFYVHDKMGEFLENVKPHLQDGSVFLIHDFSRDVPLEEVLIILNFKSDYIYILLNIVI